LKKSFVELCGAENTENLSHMGLIGSTFGSKDTILYFSKLISFVFQQAGPFDETITSAFPG